MEKQKIRSRFFHERNDEKGLRHSQYRCLQSPTTEIRSFGQKEKAQEEKIVGALAMKTINTQLSKVN